MKFLDHDIVKLKHKIGLLEIGAQGTVVMCFKEPTIAYLIEFCDDEGNTVDMPIVMKSDIELFWRDGVYVTD